jgi:hypothetical protein
MHSRLATCSCGKLAVRAEGEPVRVSVCHCLACQKRTGSAFAVQARFAAERVVIEGVSGEYERAGDQGGGARFNFCPECGATVYYRLDAEPGLVAIPLGAFADPGFPQPTISSYRVRQHPWVQLADSIVQYD